MEEYITDYLGQGKATPKRKAIWAKSDGLCWYCGGPATQIDHIHPIILGGGDRIENLVPVCSHCNKSKRGYPLEVWRKRLALKIGLAFTPEQRRAWGDRLPDDVRYIFWFETRELE